MKSRFFLHGLLALAACGLLLQAAEPQKPKQKRTPNSNQERPAADAAGKDKQPGEPKLVRSVEGISEYVLDNGLRLLLFPDNSKPTVTVNLTVFVGSRHEGYGEAGMAHLLEHMLFKGTPTHPQVPKVLQERGAEFNGTTWLDRTNYYETLPASDGNLEFAIRLEADRMVNSLIRAEDLTSEMTVVRNEFERGENTPAYVLSQRMMGVAFQWHNYGKATIGNRADIERVPVENLRDFYRKYYQPDNALLVVAGKFDEEKALGFAQQYFGAIPKPDRELPNTYTQEPAQDGERFVRLRRVGDVALVGALYHIPSGAHPDYVPIDVLERVLTANPYGRLYKALVETKKAARVSGAAYALHDPGVLRFMAEATDKNSAQAVLDNLLDVISKVAEDGVTDEEVELARQELLKQRELTAADSAELAVELSEWAAQGDWRLYFLYRDRLEQVTPDDVRRVAAQYLQLNNRTVGIFQPTEQPQRVEIPETPDLEEMIGEYEGRESLATGETFDVSPQNIEERTQRLELPEGLKVALLPKKTRGEAVVVRLSLRYGSAESLKGLVKTAEFLPSLMTRGTKDLSNQELQALLDKYRTELSASGSAGEATFALQTRREFLPQVLDLLRQVLREPALSEAELAILKQQEQTSLEQNLNDPMALAPKKVSRALNPYPPEDVRYVPTIPEEIESLETVTPESVRKLYDEYLGAHAGELTIVGDFDADETLDTLKQMLAGWKSDIPYERISRTGDIDVEGSTSTIATPDKANAVYFAGTALPLSDKHPDYPALVIGNYVLGAGALSSRLGDRIRQREGLSYGVGSVFRASALDERATYSIYAIFNPENLEKVKAAVREEINLLLKEGITQEELQQAAQGFLQRQEVTRSDDGSLASILQETLLTDRTMQYYAELEQKIQQLTPEQITEALRKHLDPESLVIVTAGDFKAAKPEKAGN